MTEGDTAAALLAARTFGRVEWLGLSQEDLVRRSLHLDRKNGAAALANTVRRIAKPSSTGPLLSAEIARVLAECHYDPLKLLLQGTAGERDAVAHIFPFDLVSGSEPIVTADGADPPEVADAHLHSGASLRLDSLIDLSCQASVKFPKKLDKVMAFDAIGECFSIGVVLAAIRPYLVLERANRSGWHAVVPNILLEHWENGTYWTAVRNTARMTDETEEGTISWSDLAAAPVLDLDDEVGGSLLVTKLLRETSAIGTFRDRRNVLGLVGAIFLVNGFLFSTPGEGLNSFVDRFDQMGLLRDRAVAQTRAALVKSAVDRNMRSGFVSGAEFRKSVFANTDSTVEGLEAVIRQGLADHLDGFRASDAVTVAPRRLTMPVTFLRVREGAIPVSRGITPAFSLKPLWRLALAIMNVASSQEFYADYVGAVDVVGDELAVPNWVFVPLLDYLGGCSEQGGRRLVRSCHAGESFLMRLQGLRSVGELLRPNRVVDRIGHALSLDPLVSDFVVGSSPLRYSRRAAVDDLCWLISCGLVEARAREMLERVIADSGLLGVGLEVDDCIEAWVARRSIRGWEGFGLAGGINDPPVALGRIRLSMVAGSYLAMLLISYRGTQYPFDVLDSQLGAEVMSAYRKFDFEVCEEVEAAVRSWIQMEEVIIEACPTSNMRLAGLPRVQYLPLRRWVDDFGLKVSLNSDDPLIFGNSIAEEANLVEAVFGRDLLNKMAVVSVDNCSASVIEGDMEDYALAARGARLATGG